MSWSLGHGADPGLRDVLRYLQTGEAEGLLSSEIDALLALSV